MATQKQIDANRRNAQKSTGPRSPEGKASSSMNALKSGLHAESELLPYEDAATYDALIARFYADHNPATALECEYLDEIIYCTWILRRLRRAEAQLWQYEHKDAIVPSGKFPMGQVLTRIPKTFTNLQWRMDNTRRALDRAVRALRDLQAELHAADPAPVPEPAAEPAPVTSSPVSSNPEIGFVPEPLPPARETGHPEPAHRSPLPNPAGSLR